MNKRLAASILVITSFLGGSVLAEPGDDPAPPTYESWDHKIGTGETTWALVARAISVEVNVSPLTSAQETSIGALIRQSTDNQASTPHLNQSIEYDPQWFKVTPPTTTTTTLPATTTTIPATTTSTSTTVATTTTTTTTQPSTTTTTLPSTTTTTTVPPGGGTTAYNLNASPAAFFDNFDWHWAMLPDPRGGPQDGQTAQGDHGHSVVGGVDVCTPPTNLRTVPLAVPESNIYWCAPAGGESGHIMTATPYTGYGLMSFTPKRSFTDVTKVCWDQNLTFLGGRRWAMMLVVPEAVYQNPRTEAVGGGPLVPAPPAGAGTSPKRIDFASPGFGPGEDVGALNLDTPGSVTSVKVFVGAMFWHPNSGNEAGNGPAHFDVTDKATRYTHCIEDLNNGTVRMSQEQPGGGVWSDTFTGGLPDDEVRVIFQDDRYDTDIQDHPITWHWDDIIITEAP